jgi:AraC-like DNA-binding protein
MSPRSSDSSNNEAASKLHDPVKIGRRPPRVAPGQRTCFARGVTRLDELRDRIVSLGRDGIQRDVIPGVSIAVFRAPTAPQSNMSEPSVALVAGGRKRTTVGVTEFVYGPGQFLVASVDLPVTGHVSEASVDDPFAVVTMTLKPALIAEVLLDAGAAARPSRSPGVAVDDASPELVDAVHRLLGLVDHPADLAALGAAAEREIVWRLLTSGRGELVRQIGMADGAIAHISGAMRWMRENVAEQVTIEELAQLSRMSVSSFHRHFRAATSMTPVQWLKALRLREARTMLLTDRSQRVADVAHAVGYGNASQFSREYRRAFGNPPHRDVAGMARDAQ